MPVHENNQREYTDQNPKTIKCNGLLSKRGINANQLHLLTRANGDVSIDAELSFCITGHILTYMVL